MSSMCPADRPTCRRRIWCTVVGEDVEVQFEARGIPGLRRPVAVRSCAAFDPRDAVACRRQCLDPTYRRPWPAGLPVGFRWG